MKKKRARKLKGRKLTDLPARVTSGARARAISGGTQMKDSIIQNIGR